MRTAESSRWTRLAVVVRAMGAIGAMSVLTGCGGGGGGGGPPAAPADVAGEWTVRETTDETACGGGRIEEAPYNAQVVQTGGGAVFTTPFAQFQGTVEGQAVRFGGTYADGPEWVQIAYSLVFAQGDFATGTASWSRSLSATGLPILCSGTTQVTATRHAPRLRDVQGIAGNASALGVAAFPDGSFVASGSYARTATFAAGRPDETTLTSDAVTEGYVARYRSDGSLRWARSAPGAGYGVATAPDGSCVVTGGLTGVTLTRYLEDGTEAWTRSHVGFTIATSLGVGVFPDGSCVVTGTFGRSLTLPTGTDDPLVLPAAGLYDFFVAKYSSDGFLQWAKASAGSWIAEAFAVSAGGDGSVLVTGGYAGRTVLGLGEPNETVLDTGGGSTDSDAFVARYAADGSLAWARRAGGAGHDAAHGNALMSGGSCVVAGVLGGEATFGAGEPGEVRVGSDAAPTAFLARFGPDGALAWVETMEGAQSVAAYGVSVSPTGSIQVAGSFAGSVRFGADPAWPRLLVSDVAGPDGFFLARYDADGALRGATRARGGGNQTGVGVATFADGSCAVAGFYDGAATFGPGEPNETTLVAGGGFVARYEGP